MTGQDKTGMINSLSKIILADIVIYGRPTNYCAMLVFKSVQSTNVTIDCDLWMMWNKVCDSVLFKSTSERLSNSVSVTSDDCESCSFVVFITIASTQCEWDVRWLPLTILHWRMVTQFQSWLELKSCLIPHYEGTNLLHDNPLAYLYSAS